MISSSKVSLKGQAVKFSVLRPYPKIIALARSFKKAPFGQNYMEVVEQDFGLRRYRVKTDSF
jgi:hypothetical protein